MTQLVAFFAFLIMLYSFAEWETYIGPRRVALEGRHTAEVFEFLNKPGDAYNESQQRIPNTSNGHKLPHGFLQRGESEAYANAVCGSSK